MATPWDKNGWITDPNYRHGLDYAVAVYKGDYGLAKQNYDWLKSNNALRFIEDGYFYTEDRVSSKDFEKRYGKTGATKTEAEGYYSYEFENLNDRYKKLESAYQTKKANEARIERENNFGNVRKGEAEIEAENAADANAKAESQATLLTAKGNGMDGHTMLTKGYLKKKQLGAA